MPRKIDVMIIGAQKAGTTSLLRYLGEHPRCVSHPQKEFAYFLDSNEYKNSYEKAFTKYFSEQKIEPDSIIVAKSASLSNQEYAIKYLHEHNPDCEIIFMLRDPIDRAYSSYWMERNAGSVSFDFDENELTNIINDPQRWEYQLFLKFGLYAQHLKNIYKYFPKEQVNIIFYDDLKNDALSVCKKIFSKLKIDPGFIPKIEVKHNITLKTHSGLYSKVIVKALHKKSVLRKMASTLIPTSRAYKYGNVLRDLNKSKDTYFPMSEKARNILTEFFKPYNEELYNLLKTLPELPAWLKNQ